jgi:hypothetical protein
MVLLSKTLCQTQYIRSRRRSQGSLSTLTTLIALHVVKDPEAYFLSLSETKRRVFNQFVFWDNKFRINYFSQTTIAHAVGISRKHLSEILLEFEQLGLIKSIYRHLKTNIYKLANIFYSPKLRSRLVKFCAAFSFIPWHMIGFTNGVWSKVVQTCEVTQYKNIISKSYITKPFDLNTDLNPGYITLTGARARGEGYGKVKVGQISGGIRVDSNSIPIRQSIRALKQLNLTLQGEMKLSVFPDKALEYGMRKMKNMHLISDKFAYFWGICSNFCKENGLKVEWSVFNRLKDQYPDVYTEGCAMTHTLTTPTFGEKPQDSAHASPQSREWGADYRAARVPCPHLDSCDPLLQKALSDCQCLHKQSCAYLNHQSDSTFCRKLERRGPTWEQMTIKQRKRQLMAIDPTWRKILIDAMSKDPVRQQQCIDALCSPDE